MKKITIPVFISVAVLLIVFFIVFPHVEIKTESQLIRFSYTGDFSEYDNNHSYNEIYCYYPKRDISIRSFDVQKFLFFYRISMEYIDGDFREKQFVLPESYIENFLENAVIESNTNNIAVADLIQGKTAIVGNTKYPGNDYTNAIFYQLDGRYEEMYVFESDGLVVIQVGSPDELPKYIAYR